MTQTTPVRPELNDNGQQCRRSTRRQAWLFIGSTVVTALFFGLELGWQDAMLLCGIFLIHEMGHYVAARHRGVSCALPFLTPFGALVVMNARPSCARDQAFISLAGPLSGGAFSLVLVIVGAAAARATFLDVGLFGLGLNLLQLTPAMPFDGGYIAYSFGEWFPLLGAAVVTVLAALSILPIWMLIAAIVGAMQFMLIQALDRRAGWRSCAPSSQASTFQLIITCAFACTVLGIALLVNTHSLDWIFA